MILFFDVLLFSLFDGRRVWRSASDAAEHAVVLAAVKDASRR
jgi:hypothetical protein